MSLDLMTIEHIRTAINGVYGTWIKEPLTCQQAKELLKNNPWTSTVSHSKTADAHSQILDTKIPVSKTLDPHKGDTFLVFNLKNEPPYGQTLDHKLLEQLQYEICLMTYTGMR